MSSKVLLGFLGLLFFIEISQASICVNTVSELEEKKAQMPVLLQKLPMMLSVDSLLVTAAIKIRAIGDKLKLEGSVWSPGSISTEECYVKKACFEKDILTVTLENEVTYEARVVSDKALEIENVPFKVSNDSQFAQVLERIKKATPANAATTRGGNNGAKY